MNQERPFNSPLLNLFIKHCFVLALERASYDHLKKIARKFEKSRNWSASQELHSLPHCYTEPCLQNTNG